MAFRDLAFAGLERLLGGIDFARQRGERIRPLCKGVAATAQRNRGRAFGPPFRA